MGPLLTVEKVPGQSGTMCKEVSGSLPLRGDSHDDRYDDHPPNCWTSFLRTTASPKT